MVDDACNEILQIDISDNVSECDSNVKPDIPCNKQTTLLLEPDIIIDDTIDHKIKEDVVSLYNNCYKNALIPSSPETDYEMRITLKSIFDPSRLKHWMHNNCESASDSEGENHSVEVEDNLSSGSAEL
ncbi:hypothetical protein PPYR_15627 [Photinus pyralis]|uniref:Uncharacterized protein n=1 Tax=Photinus pyralis TaxID=7054 RepID=A0A5N3ZYB8_PHOPY|nr:hypothetical protein PPYR_15627 [Photinus pyralis]